MLDTVIHSEEFMPLKKYNGIMYIRLKNNAKLMETPHCQIKPPPIENNSYAMWCQMVQFAHVMYRVSYY